MHKASIQFVQPGKVDSQSKREADRLWQTDMAATKEMTRQYRVGLSQSAKSLEDYNVNVRFNTI